jgi:hypothetical protein
MSRRPYDQDTKGHDWIRYPGTGMVDILAYETGYHNGPRCSKCGYGFCHHCSKLPEESCPRFPRLARFLRGRRRV